MSDFDPDEFMNSTIDQPLETERTLCPEGEYKAMIDDFTRDAFETFEFEYKRGPNAGQPGSMTNFSIPFVIDDDKVKQSMEMDKVVVFKRVVLDFADGGKALAWGKNKNIELGKIRKAVGQNNPGPWSPAMLRNAGPLMVKVVHRKGKRKDGSDFVMAEIERVAPIV